MVYQLLCVSQVCKKAMRLLAQVEQEPLFNLEQLNPELVTHAEAMAEAHSLRQRLRLLGDYLLSCRSGACKKLQARCVCVCMCDILVGFNMICNNCNSLPEWSSVRTCWSLTICTASWTYDRYPALSFTCDHEVSSCFVFFNVFIYFSQIAEGQYATYLLTLIQYASKHVYQCDLCTQRGFICQICHSDDIIFPFQFDCTTR